MSDNNYEGFDFSHCINPGCDYKLSPDFDCYVINRDEVREGEIKRYKCPKCSAEWTVEDQQINSVEVKNFKPNEDFVLVSNDKKLEGVDRIVARYSAKNVIKIGNKFYIHAISTKLNNSRMFNLDGKLSDEDILKHLEEQEFI